MPIFSMLPICGRKFWTEKQRTAHAKSHTYQKVSLLQVYFNREYQKHFLRWDLSFPVPLVTTRVTSLRG